MKTFSEFLKENKLLDVDFLKEDFEDARDNALKLYRKIKTEYDSEEDKEEKLNILKTHGEELYKAINKCIPFSASERKFFNADQAKVLKFILNRADIKDNDVYTYLDLAYSSDEEKDEWEKSISLKASKDTTSDKEDVTDDEDKKEPVIDTKKIKDADDEVDAMKKSKEDKDDDLVKPEIASKMADHMISTAKDKVTEKVTKRAICIVDEQIDEDTPRKGSIGITSLVEHSILGLTTLDEVKAAITDSVGFKTEKDFTRKLKALKDGSEKIKVFFYNTTVEEEDPWRVEIL